MSSRSLATWSVLAVAGIVAALGVTWAAESTAPRLERTSSAVLFDDVQLYPGVPVQRCAGIVPRGAGLVGLGFDGDAVGSLGPSVRIRVERGSGRPEAPTDCGGFVPVATAYDGPLDRLPPAESPSTTPVSIERDRPIAYRATLTLPDPASGATRFGLRITGHFAEQPPPPASPAAPPPTAPPPPAVARCLQLQSGPRIQRTTRDGGLRVVVRTPRALPIQLVRPLPIYVTTRNGVRPRVVAGPYGVPLRRTTGGRWVGHVPVAALRRSPNVRVSAGRGTVTVPVRTRSCTARVRSFLRSDGTLDLRIDTRQPLSGLRLRLPAVVGRTSGGRVRVGAVTPSGRGRASAGRVGVQGRDRSSRLPRIMIDGRTIELLDVPRGVRTVSLRLRVARPEAARHAICRGSHATRGRIVVAGASGTERDVVRSPLLLIGDRCPRR